MTSCCGIVDPIYFITVIVFYLVIANSTPVQSASMRNVCSTDECKVFAQEISLKMDGSVRPCDDFYSFVCGKFIKNNSPTRTQLDLYENMRSESEAKLISLLEKNDPKKTIKPFRQISRLYQLCMDQNTLIKQGAQPLRDILNQFGGWPLLEGSRWSGTGSDWVTITGKLVKLGFPFDLFLKFSVINTRMTPNQRIITLDRPLIQHKLDRVSAENVYTYYDDSVKNAVKLGATKRNAEEALQESQQLLIDLINIISNTKPSTRVMSLSDLSTRWPGINWTMYFSNILSISSAAPIDKTDSLTVDDAYMDELMKFIDKTSPRVLMNYVLSRVVDESLLYIRIENITHLPSSRSDLCLKIVSEQLPNIVDAMFALNYVEDDKRRETISMVATITEQFVKIIQEAVWLDNETRSNAVKKLLSMTTVVGYPDEWKSKEWMNLYNDLELEGESFLRCILDVIRFKKRFRYQTGRSHIEDGQRLVQMNRMPYYRFYENKIIISAGFLQYILVDSKLPKYMNYATMGFFIGHELTHAFDGVDELLKLNKNLMQSSKDKFLNESACIINQYSNYNVEEINSRLDGSLGIRENMADNVGAKLAYMAYTNGASRNGTEPVLSNLNYTTAQMFWINMASPWCTKIHPDILRDLISDKHSPARYRVNGALSNNVNFSKDFSCPVGSKMNPTRKCQSKEQRAELAYSAYTNWMTRNPPEPALSNLEYTQMFWISWASTWCKRMIPFKGKVTMPYSPSEYRIIGAASN